MPNALRHPIGWFVVLLAGVLLATACRAHPVTLIVGREEIQRRLDAKFPIEQQVLLAKVTLERPEVLLREGSDRIGLRLPVRVDVPALPGSRGRIAVTGTLEYRRQEQAFYLRDPRLEALELDGLHPEHAALVREPVEAAVRGALAGLPIYRLDGEELKDLGARHLLDGVVVRDGKLRCTLAVQ